MEDGGQERTIHSTGSPNIELMLTDLWFQDKVSCGVFLCAFLRDIINGNFHLEAPTTFKQVRHFYHVVTRKGKLTFAYIACVHRQTYTDTHVHRHANTHECSLGSTNFSQADVEGMRKEIVTVIFSGPELRHT